MVNGAFELFYSYALEDEALLGKLDNHLAGLKKQGLISTWYKREISPGQVWTREIDAHLRSARIIVLLVSPDFLASEYCYGVELQEAIKRHVAGEARVVPVILRPCDWQETTFGKMQPLPKNAKAVTTWPNRDLAYTDIVKGIRQVISELSGEKIPEATGKKQTKSGGGSEGKPMAPTSTTIKTPALKKAVENYRKKLDYYMGQAEHELGLRGAFQELLVEASRLSDWRLSPEETLEGNIRPDGVLRDEFNLRRGYWEAKGPKGDLEKEISKKMADRYPLTNTIFENTRRAVLFQSKKRVFEADLQNANETSDLLRQFLTYVEPDIENFEVAVEEFKSRIPELAHALIALIEKEYKENKKFITAFDQFAELCRTSLNPQISKDAIKEMLVQHLLTERLFRTIFNNSDFIDRNVIAVEIEKVIRALTSRAFRQEFLRSLDRFYVAIENAAKGIESWSERQHFLNTVYERFFQGFSIKQADTYGINYTPQEIVDFMCASVEEVLQREFETSIAEPGVQILDPATGTGSFIVNLLHRIPSYKLKHKYKNDFFCNEIMLLPYYIASLNIEHEYYERTGTYEPFEGICFADTLELAEGKQLAFDMFTEENTERVKREKQAEIMVVIANPPYNIGQKSENDNNKNRPYPVIDKHIQNTYSKASEATLNNKLYDHYVRFFRWATDRLQGRDGIVCFISNNSFIDQFAFDGMRMHLQKDFTQIYHLDLHGNVRKNPKLSGTTHNIFGIQVGVGITVAVRRSKGTSQGIKYYRIPEFWTKTDKIKFLEEKKNITNIEWSELQPDSRHNWITEGLRPEFTSFLPIGTKEAKGTKGTDANAVFKLYSLGVVTSRDEWVYDFDKNRIEEKMRQFIKNYNSEVFRWSQESTELTLVSKKDTALQYIDDFVNNATSFLKWTDRLKEALYKQEYLQFEETKIHHTSYRPFCKQFLYFDHLLNQRRYQQYLFFPISVSESENIVICVPGPGDRKGFGCLATNTIASMDLAFEKVQCFPFYVYAEDGTSRRENVTDWTLAQFQAIYNSSITKWDIFHYVYGILHHPQYRERYAENLKRDLPHVPLLHTSEAFSTCVRIGKQLMDLHLNYEQADEYKKLEWFENKDVPFSWRVEKMRLSTDKRVVVVNESLRLGPIPPECFEYRLGNRSALEWVIDQYQVSEDKRSGIVSDPNRLEDEEYIVRLVGKVVTVSVETVRLVRELAEAIRLEDWLEEGVEVDESGER